MRKLARLVTVLTAAAAFAPLAANAMTAPIMDQSMPQAIQKTSGQNLNALSGGRPAWHQQVNAIRHESQGN